MSLHPRSSVRKVPPYVRFSLRYLADRVSGSRHYNCAVSMESTTVAPRVDAQASSERTGIGGWFLHRGQDGKIDIRGSRWFSLELIEEEWPWIFARVELASYMRRMSLWTVVEWAHREGNKEADKLANGNAEDFDPSLRIDVSASTLIWDILPEALEAGGAAERQSQAARERGALPDRCRKGKRRRPEERLRLKDPW